MSMCVLDTENGNATTEISPKAAWKQYCDELGKMNMVSDYFIAPIWMNKVKACELFSRENNTAIRSL